MNASRNRLLIGIAAILIAIKFLLLPWLDHQAGAVERLAVLTKRLDRAEGVVSNRAAIEKSVLATESSTTSIRKRFPDALDLESFQLGTQQSVGTATSENGLSVKLFEWVVDGEAKAARLSFSRARFQVDGGFRQLVTLQSNLEARFPNMFVRELSLSAPGMISAPDESLASMTLVADFYFRPAAVKGSP